MIRVLRSTSVRLALGYALLFVASSLVLVGFLWWRTAAYLDREINAVILADARAVADQLRDFGLPGAIDVIHDRVAHAADEHAVYLLADPAHRPIAGNLDAWPATVGAAPGMYQADLVRNGKIYAARILNMRLSEGYSLLVGRDVQDRAEAVSLIVNSLGWAAVGALLIAVAGGFFVRRAVLRRVNDINRTASAIVHGDLSRRLPSRGTTDEFDQLAQTINAMLRQIETLIEGVRNASNAVAHDLRTPLTELRAELEGLVRRKPPPETVYEELHKAVDDIDRLIAIFNALLRLAEIDSGVRRSGFRRVDLSGLATEVSDLYTPLMEEKEVLFTVDAPRGLAVNGDPFLLAQAIGNLVDNAVKFTRRGGRISLRIARRADGPIEIAVADDGPGIQDADKPRVTGRFVRGAAATETPGLGLGLSVVEAIARLHDGTLTFEDAHPGLIARLALPALPDAGA